MNSLIQPLALVPRMCQTHSVTLLESVTSFTEGCARHILEGNAMCEQVMAGGGDKCWCVLSGYCVREEETAGGAVPQGKGV